MDFAPAGLMDNGFQRPRYPQVGPEGTGMPRAFGGGGAKAREKCSRDDWVSSQSDLVHHLCCGGIK